MGHLARFLLGAVALAHVTIAATDSADSSSSAVTPLVPRTWKGAQYACKCYFGDSCWPKAQKWTALNTTVQGNLALYIPPESVCHNTFNGTLGTLQTYDAAKCAAMTAAYGGEQWT